MKHSEKKKYKPPSEKIILIHKSDLHHPSGVLLFVFYLHNALFLS